MDNQKIIILLSLIIVLLVGYKMILSYETFNQLDICDYDSPNPSAVCKGIKKGCTHLKNENKELNTNIDKNCTNLPTDTKDLINTAINCDDTVNKLIMNNYVQKEVCSQIINFPTDDKLTSISNPIPEEEVLPPPTYKPNESIFETTYYLNGQNQFSPF